MAKHQATGLTGEILAAQWLADRGYAVLHRNWRHSYYEIDIIAAKDKIVHFIEVKTRRGQQFGEPEESVTKKKLTRVMKAAEAFQFAFPGWQRVQYDVLSITIHDAESASFYFIEDVYI